MVGSCFSDQHRADSAGKEMLRGYDKAASVKVKDAFEGADYTSIGCDAAGEYDRLDEVPAAAEIAFEVSSKCKTKAGDDVAVGRCLLLKVNHIGLCEYGTAAGHSGRVLALEGERAELLLDIYAEAGWRFVMPFGLSILIAGEAGAQFGRSLYEFESDPAPWFGGKLAVGWAF